MTQTNAKKPLIEKNNSPNTDKKKATHHSLLLAHVVVVRDAVERDAVVQAAARDEGARRRVRARHHPRGGHGHHVLLARAEAVPDHELAVLRGARDVTLVAAPVQRQHLDEKKEINS